MRVCIRDVLAIWVAQGRRQGMKRLIRLMDETREKYKDELVRIDALVESVDRIAEEHKERQHFEREKARAKKLKSDKAAALDTRSQPVKPNAHGAIRPPRPLHSHQRQPRPPVLAVKTAAEADTIKLKTALQSQASPRALSNTSGSPKLQVGNDETTANSQNPDPRTSTSPSSPKTQDRASDDGFQGLSDGLMLEVGLYINIHRKMPAVLSAVDATFPSRRSTRCLRASSECPSST